MSRRAPPASIPRCLRVIPGGRRASSPKKVNGQKQKFRPFGPDFLAILLFVFDADNFLRSGLAIPYSERAAVIKHIFLTIRLGHLRQNFSRIECQ